MSKMSELARQTEKEEIAYLNSLREDEKEILSSCCGYEPMGELHYDNESKEVEMVGLCSKCKDHADFEEV
jgi:hypothetical protein